MTRIKICGITSLQDALAVVQYGSDALGFVFAESPRKISPERAREIILRLPPFITTVGVFVDEPAEMVQEMALLCRLDALQFHGHESPEYCQYFDRKVIKAFKMGTGSIDQEMARYDVDAYLLDSSTGGGSGQRFNWDLATGVKGRIILAGGLTPENVAQAIAKVRPYAVDVSTGVEISPGRKDHPRMKEFIRNVRQYD
jgi:phosphoribosylanthranilate isomerase